MEELFNIPIMACKDVGAWETWIKSHYSDENGVWLKIAKKDSGIASVSYHEALDVCLCYGWIDGQRRKYDETYYLQKYTPRRKKSLWSKVNIGKVAMLIEDGRMQDPGLKAIEEAKADGRWDRAYESQSKAVIPADLEAVLSQNKAAKEQFESLRRADRYHILFQLMTAHTLKIRDSRLQKIIQQLEKRKE